MPGRQAFLAALPSALGAEAAGRDDLDRVCARLLAEGRASHPRLGLDDAAFLAHLAARLPRDRGLDAALAAVRAGDLYLAAGCSAGLPLAFSTFDRACLAPLHSTLARLAVAGVDADDLAQLVRARLLAPDRQGRRRIADYAGVGSLARWVRTAAVRLALNAGRGVHEVATEDAALAARLRDDRDGELSFLRARYRPAFAAALRDALAALDAADQNLLRQRYVDGLTLEELGALAGVHRATALRRLERARAALIDDIRSRLRATLRVQTRELESLLRLFATRLDVTLSSGT